MMEGQAKRPGEQAKEESGSSGAATGRQKETGDPGRTPGKAEGDEKTVAENLSRKGDQERGAPKR
jgi:hypothetical protein